MPEMVQSGGTFGSWPLNLPPGSQTWVTLDVPYRFFGLTEQLSWLAQFAGQGFEDISALANLVLLQEAMLTEEYQLIAGTSVPLTAPGTPTCVVRSAGSNETAFNTTITAVKVAATNYFGSTAVSAASTTFAVGAGQVVDVTIPAVTGGMNYTIYGYDGTHYYVLAQGVGGIRYTLQGFATLPAIVTPPAADTGTGKATRMEGVIPTLSGASANASVYPPGWKGGYVNNVGTHLSINAIFTALDALLDSTANSPGVYKADPSEIIAGRRPGEPLQRHPLPGRGPQLPAHHLAGRDRRDAGRGAVAEFVNPVTQSTLKMIVHPWMSQGTALLMSYQLPQTWCHVGQRVGDDLRAGLR